MLFSWRKVSWSLSASEKQTFRSSSRKERSLCDLELKGDVLSGWQLNRGRVELLIVFIFTLTLPDRRRAPKGKQGRWHEKGKYKQMRRNLYEFEDEQTGWSQHQISTEIWILQRSKQLSQIPWKRMWEVTRVWPTFSFRNCCCALATYPVSGFCLSSPGGCNRCLRIVLFPGKEGKHYIAGLIFSRRKWPHWKSHLWLIVDTQTVFFHQRVC